MNHPSNEQWMSFCYDEISAEERGRLAKHLRACPQCFAEINAWQKTQKDLDAWRIPAFRRSRPFLPVALKWAAAAVLLFTTFCLGRFALATRDLPPAVQARLTDQLRHELGTLVHEEATLAAAASEQRIQQQLAAFMAEAKAERARNGRAVFAALEKIDNQRASDYASLKKDLDTLAVNADAQLRTTERHLLQVATLAQPVNAPNP